MASRLMACLGLVSTLLWVAAPAVAAAWPTSHKSDSCACCDMADAVVDGIGCPGCQAAPAEQAAAPASWLVASFAWSSRAPAVFDGIEPQPADPPPR